MSVDWHKLPTPLEFRKAHIYLRRLGGDTRPDSELEAESDGIYSELIGMSSEELHKQLDELCNDVIERGGGKSA